VNVSCPDCRSVFRVDPAKVPAGGVRARCSVCSGIIPVPPPEAESHRAVPPVGEAARAEARAGDFATSAAMPWSGAAEQSAGVATAPRPVSPPPTPPDAQQARGPRPAGAAAPSAPAPAAAQPGRRPINPFLAKDPDLRARRLARALVSDIITYHPAKHAEGLRDGTVRDLFRDEIRKSYEEYSAQVGQQIADSTPYFQDALNEVLGAGKKIF
jgi:predicted Zn finger-like uncharacterized protein